MLNLIIMLIIMLLSLYENDVQRTVCAYKAACNIIEADKILRVSPSEAINIQPGTPRLQVAATNLEVIEAVMTDCMLRGIYRYLIDS
jgi:hypothetical protein